MITTPTREARPGSIARMQIRDACTALADRYGFTGRERDLLFAMACGTTSAPELATRLLLRPNTVHNHLKGMFRRSGVSSKSALLALLLQSEVERAERRERFQTSAPVLLLGCDALAQPLSELGLRVQRGTLNSDEIAASRSTADVVVAPWGSAEQARRLRERIGASFGRNPLCLFVSDDEVRTAEGGDSDAPLPMQAHRIAFEVLLHRAEGPYDRTRLLRIDCDLRAVVDERLATSLWNIGFGGAFVRMSAAVFAGSARLRPGDTLRLSVALPDESAIDLRAEVVWTRTGERPAWPSGVGVQFTVAPDGDMARLRDAVRLARLGLFQLAQPPARRPTEVAV